MLMLPRDEKDFIQWSRELIDQCTMSANDRGIMYARATQYYYTGSYDARAAIYNKVKGFVNKLAGYLMQPTDVRFTVVFDSGEPDSVLERAQLVGEKLTADFKETDCDVKFAEGVVWALVNGCYFLKPARNLATKTFTMTPVHPQSIGVLSETTLALEEQEAICHVSYPTISRLNAELMAYDHPRRRDIIDACLEAKQHKKDEEQPAYQHQMVIGGLQPLGAVGDAPSAAGIVQVFPVPTPWRPTKFFSPWNETVRHCELWVKSIEHPGDYVTIQMVYPDILIEGFETRRNIGGIPGHVPFIKIQPVRTPGYFFGRSVIADVQMLQDVLNKRLRDLTVTWDRNTNAPQLFSGFTGLTEEMYYKIINEGGFIADPNPNAKAQKLTEPPQQGYLEELEFLWKMFDEAGGFSSIMSGQGEPGVRAGTHAQTLVRTSSPALIDQAARLERQLADAGYLALKLMQDEDAMIYTTDKGTDFLLSMLPPNFQVQVDSHSASPAFQEDNRQVAIALARAGAIDAEDLIHLLHPPSAELLLARLRQRQKAQAQQAQQEEQKNTILSLVTGKKQQTGGGRPGGRRARG